MQHFKESFSCFMKDRFILNKTGELKFIVALSIGLIHGDKGNFLFLGSTTW